MELQLDEWLKPEHVAAQKKPEVEFLDEGEITEGEFDGKKVDQFSIGVSLNGGPALKWTMNKTSQRATATHHGPETKEWVGKSVAVRLENAMVSGKSRQVIYAVEKDGVR